MAVVLAHHLSPVAPDHVIGRDHPRTHLAEDLRSRVRDDLRRARFLDGYAEPLHVDLHVPAVSLLARCRNRDRAVADGGAADRALPDLESPWGDRTMSALAATVGRPRARLSPLRIALYAVMIALGIFYLTPVFAIVVTSLKTTA